MSVAVAQVAAFLTATVLEAPAWTAPVIALSTELLPAKPARQRRNRTTIATAAVGVGVVLGSVRIWPLIDPNPATAHSVPRPLRAEPSETGVGLTIIANSAAGDSAGADAIIAKIARRLPDARILPVEPDRLGSALDEAGRTSVAIGVIGGDGTVGAAARAASRAGIPLAVFPGGTLNHFARDVDLDTVEASIDAVRHGHLIEVDTAVIDGRTFINTASFGTYSRFVESRERHEQTIGKWPAVIVALVRELVDSKPFPVTIDGVDRKVWMIFIGNCRYEPSGFVPATRLRLDDGLLDVRFVDGSQPAARLRLIAAMITGNLTRSPVYTRRLVERLEISTNQRSNLLAADGEIFDGNTTFSVTKRNASLRLFVPRPDRSSARSQPSEMSVEGLRSTLR